MSKTCPLRLTFITLILFLVPIAFSIKLVYSFPFIYWLCKVFCLAFLYLCVLYALAASFFMYVEIPRSFYDYQAKHMVFRIASTSDFSRFFYQLVLVLSFVFLHFAHYYVIMILLSSEYFLLWIIPYASIAIIVVVTFLWIISCIKSGILRSIHWIK